MNGDATSSVGQSRADLRKKFDRAFSVEDLKLLCDDLGVDPQDIPGQDQGKEFWIGQIILYFERRGQVAALLARARELRPNVDWSYTPGPGPDPPPPMSSPPGPRIPRVYLYLGVGLLAAVVVAAMVLRPVLPSQSQSPVTVAAGAPTPQPKMTGLFNVAVADFGQFDESGQLHPSPDGQRIKQALADSLKLEVDSLPVGVKQDLKPDVRSEGLGLVRNDIEAEQLAQNQGAEVVVYGNLMAGQPPSSLAPKFYVSRLNVEAADMTGSHSLGEPLQLRLPLTNDGLQALNFALTYRQKLLTGFTLGLLYNSYGRHAEAQKVLTRTWDEVKGRPEKEGKEVLQYFIGREYLFQADALATACASTPAPQNPACASSLDNRTLAAEWFNKALQQNPNYARGYIGLAGVDYQKARTQTPEERLTPHEALDQSIENYGQALDKAKATDTQIAAMASLGLGSAYRLRGAALLETDPAKADDEFKQAIDYLNPPLDYLERSGQHRLLALGYQYLGIAYEQAGESRKKQNDKEGASKLYRSALDAYTKCKAEGNESPADADIATYVQALCSPHLDAVNQALKSLE